MAATLQRNLVADTTQVAQARDLTRTFGQTPSQHVRVGEGEVPDELAALIHQFLDAVAAGRTITVRSTPDVMTTTEAAQELGVSRPTLMKMVRNGAIPAHKVGTHTRLRSADVFEARNRRIEEQRQALAELMELSDQNGGV